MLNCPFIDTTNVIPPDYVYASSIAVGQYVSKLDGLTQIRVFLNPLVWYFNHVIADKAP